MSNPSESVDACGKKCFASDQPVRWCPGCGDYSILSQVQAVFAELGLPRERYAIVSGIGCASRFPYYMETYGLHGIHGRAPAIAAGLKAGRPDLEVWVVTGDGDAMAIGGNHLVHVLRRNHGVRILLCNNRIYGLTKGQFSPLSEIGKRTKSSPLGSIDEPFNPLSLVLGAGASLVARSADVLPGHMRAVLRAAHEHEGAAFIEVWQNCNIFNDGAFAPYTGRQARGERLLFLRHGEPMVWGKAKRRGLVLDGLKLESRALAEGVDERDCLVHDEGSIEQAWLLSRMEGPELPAPMGVLYRQPRPTYEARMHEQVRAARARSQLSIEDLLCSGETWTVD